MIFEPIRSIKCFAFNDVSALVIVLCDFPLFSASSVTVRYGSSRSHESTSASFITPFIAPFCVVIFLSCLENSRVKSVSVLLYPTVTPASLQSVYIFLSPDPNVSTSLRNLSFRVVPCLWLFCRFLLFRFRPSFS